MKAHRCAKLQRPGIDFSGALNRSRETHLGLLDIAYAASRLPAAFRPLQKKLAPQTMELRLPKAL